MKKFTKLLVIMMGVLLMTFTTGKSIIKAKEKPTVYTVATSHLDLVWDWTIQDTVSKYLAPTFLDNFNLLDKYPDYEFNLEQAFTYKLLKEYYPDINERLKNYIDDGRWHVAGSSLVAGDVNVPSPESLSRQFLYGNNFFYDEYGVKSNDVYLPDCFGFGYTLPTVASHMGLKSFMTQKLSWGSSVGIPFDMGVWKGIDGSELISYFNAGSYVTSFDRTINNEGLTSRVNNSSINKALQLYGVGDRGGAPSNQTVESVQRSILSNDYNVISGYVGQYADELTTEEIAKLPVYDGELLMTTHGAGSYTSVGLTKRFNRQNELLGSAAEQANVAASWLGTTSYPQEKLTNAWIRFLWNQFHDDITGTSVQEVYTQAYNDLILSLNEFNQEYSNGVQSLIRGMDTRVKEGIPVVVHNSADTKRKDLVSATLKFSPVPNYVKVYDTNGKEVPSQVVARANDGIEVTFLGEVLANGYKVYQVVPSYKPCDLDTGLSISENTLENKFYKVSINENGDISSIIDKVLAREMLNEPIQLQLITTTQNGWPAWELNYFDVMRQPKGVVGGTPEIRIVDNGPAKVSLEIDRKYNNSTFTQIISLYAGDEAKRIEVDNQVNWVERETLLKASFPLSVGNKEATYDLGLGTINRKNNTANLYEVPAQQWADISDNEYGITIMSDSKYGWDKPADNVLRLSLIHTPATDRENAKQDVMDFGDNRFKYAIMGHKNDWKNGSQQEAEKFNRPMVAFQTNQHEGSLGKDFSFASTNSDQVSIEAIKKAEKSNEIIVRVYENYGQEAKNITLNMAHGIKSAREVNGAEDNIGLASVNNGKLNFSIGKYQMKTFAITLEEPKQKLTKNNQQTLDLDFNKDVITYQGKTDGQFGSTGYSLPAEIFPSEIQSGGVNYKFGPMSTNSKNALECRGQTIQIPYGYNKIKFLANSTNNDKEAIFDVGGNKTRFTIQDFKKDIGGWDQYGINHFGYIKRDNVAYASTHTHRNGQDAIYERTYLFEYELDIPSGATTLTLPDDPSITIMAMTLVNEEESRLATNTYDVKEKVETYLLNVKNGGGSGRYPVGAPVKVSTNQTGIVVWNGYDRFDGSNEHLIEFLMPDHDVNVEAIVGSHGQDYALNKPVVASSVNGSEVAENMVNGAISGIGDKWCTIKGGTQWAYVDLGEKTTINRWVVKHAGAGGESRNYNTSYFKLQVSDDAITWVDVDSLKNNTANITDRYFNEVNARYFRLYIEKSEAAGNNVVRIFSFELYNSDYKGKPIEESLGGKITYQPLKDDYSVSFKDNKNGANWITLVSVLGGLVVLAGASLFIIKRFR